MDGLPPADLCVVQDQAPQTLAAARAARLGGDVDGARCILAGVVAEQPHNADAWVELGYVLSHAGEGEEAHAAFTRALAISPDYDDAKLGLARLAYWSGDVPAARAWVGRVSAERRDDAEVGALLRALNAADPARPRWRWDAFASYSALSNDLPRWREASLSFARRSGPLSLGLSAERLERFGMDDAFGEVRVSRQFNHGSWGMAVGGATEALFRPEAALRVEYAAPEDGVTTLDGALTIARYRVGQVDRLSLRAGRRLGDALRVSALGIVVRDETDQVRGGFGVGAAWQVNGPTRFDFAWVDAPESSEGVTLDVRAASLGVSRELREGFSIRLGVLHEERDAFDRTELTFGVSRSF